MVDTVFVVLTGALIGQTVSHTYDWILTHRREQEKIRIAREEVETLKALNERLDGLIDISNHVG